MASSLFGFRILIYSFFLHSPLTALSPIIEAMSVVRKNNLQNVAGSLKMSMPTSTAPTAPMPVHTG